MNITQFIKLIQKNLLVLLMVPVLLASLVWYMTRNESKTYISTTTVYTGIASGASLMSQEPKNVDFFGVKIVFDNFINIVQSRETMEETGVELFAQNLMLKHPQREYISDYHYRELQKKTPQVIKDLIVPGNLDATVQAMLDYKNQNDTNFLYRLLNLDDPHYSVKAISGIKAKRINNSDLIKIEYSNDDPGITKQTLVILTKVFVKKYRNIQQGQSSNVVKYFEDIKKYVEIFKKQGITVSLFIDPEQEQIKASREAGAQFVELHTGRYADAENEEIEREEFERLVKASDYVLKTGLGLNAGHGLNYRNVVPVARINGMNELNIGHSIVARAIFVGFKEAVKEMVYLVRGY